MIENQSVNIYIRDETDGNKIPVSTTAEPSGTKSAVPVSQGEAERKKDRGVVAAGVVVAQQFKPYVDQIVGFAVSQIEATTGSAELQQKTQIITGAVSSIASVGFGAAVGGVGGAAMSAALSVVTSTVSAVQNSISIENNKRIERENIARRTAALGQSVNRSRSGGST